jgi:phosphopantetheine--protein transferase-like protein
MIGIDLVDAARLEHALEQMPRIEVRLFTAGERRYCRSFPDPAQRFAGTLAAKEAVVKALDLSSIHQWARRIEIVRQRSGRPVVLVDGIESDASVSISHERSLAVAVASRTDSSDSA